MRSDFDNLESFVRSVQRIRHRRSLIAGTMIGGCAGVAIGIWCGHPATVAIASAFLGTGFAHVRRQTTDAVLANVDRRLGDDQLIHSAWAADDDKSDWARTVRAMARVRWNSINPSEMVSPILSAGRWMMIALLVSLSVGLRIVTIHPGRSFNVAESSQSPDNDWTRWAIAPVPQQVAPPKHSLAPKDGDPITQSDLDRSQSSNVSEPKNKSNDRPSASDSGRSAGSSMSMTRTLAAPSWMDQTDIASIERSSPLASLGVGKSVPDSRPTKGNRQVNLNGFSTLLTTDNQRPFLQDMPDVDRSIAAAYFAADHAASR